MKNTVKKHGYLISLVLSFLLFLLPSLSNASSVKSGPHPYYSFNQLSLNDGLSQSTVYSILRDSEGFLWIGTGMGLNRFDGQHIKRYEVGSSKQTNYLGGRIFYIVEDTQKNIWIATNFGVALYNKETDSFDIQKYRGTSFASNSYLLQDDGIIACSFGVLFKYSYTTKEWIKLPLKSRNKIDFHFTGAVRWSNEVILLSSRYNGLFFYNLRSGALSVAQYFNGLSDIRKIYLDSRQQLWLAPHGRGVYCYSKRGELLAQYSTKNSGIIHDVILDIIEHDGKIWFGTDGGGIAILDKKTEKFSYIQHTPENSASFPSNSIISLYNDHWGNLWVGSIRDGLIEVKYQQINTFRQTTLGNQYGLSNKTILSLYNENEHSIWVGTDGGGINQFNPLTEKFTHYKSTNGDKITSISRYSTNEIIVSAYGKGVYIFNKQNKSQKRLILVNKEEDDRLLNSGYATTIQSNDGINFLFIADKIYSFNRISKQFKQLNVNRISKYGNTLKQVIADDSCSYFYTANAIYKQVRNKEWRIIRTFPSEEVINTVQLDKRGGVWIGSNIGLKYLNISQRQIYKEIPLPFKGGVSSLILDHQNRLWIGTPGMLWLYHINEKRFDQFDKSYGIISNEYLARPVLVAQNGDIYMGGVNGLLCIKGGIIPQHQIAPQVHLIETSANNEQRYYYNNESSNTKQRIPTLSLPWNRSSVELKIIVQEKDLFRDRKFRYYVSGLMEDPIETNNQTFTLQALPSGTYHIKVSCSLQNGLWSKPYDILMITIAPPWWKTFWFISLVIALIIGGCYYWINIYMRSKEEKLKLTLKEREKQMYAEKVDFLINISHELRTPLTLVHAPIRRLLEEIPTKEVLNKQLTNIYKHTSHMKQIINMVLDVRKMETGNEQLNFEATDIHSWIKSKTEFFEVEMEQKQMTMLFDFDPSVEIVPIDKNKCEIVLFNLLSNAIKFGNDNSTVTIATKLNPIDQRVRISIIDQGIGLEDVDKNLLFHQFYQKSNKFGGSGIGLAFSKVLVEMHQGIIGADCNEGNGATFFFELPLKQALHNVTLQPKPYINEIFTATNTIDAEALLKDTSIDTTSYTLLAVEDNPELLAFLKHSLQPFFKKVLSAANGEEALNAIKQYNPDVVISDVVMPIMNGFELCSRIKSNINISHIPVVLLSARSDFDNIISGYKLGADAYVAKPFEIDYLQAIIQSLLKARELVKARYKQLDFTIVPHQITFSNADEKFILKLNTIIEANLSNPDLSVPFIAAEIGMSKASLYIKMKELLDVSVNDYISRIRMERSVHILINQPNKPISEIAESLGFSSQRYFSTCFKQFKGVSPSEYRDKKRNETNIS